MSVMTNNTSQHRPPLVLNSIYYAASVGFFLYMFYYYWTGIGGPTLLAMGMIPVAFVLYTLNSLRHDDFYPRLPAAANYLIATVYCGLALYCGYYMHTVLFSPDVILATLASFVVLAVIGYWMLRRRKLQEGEPEVVIAEPAFAPSAATTEVLPSMG